MHVYSPLVTTERFLGAGAGSRVYLAEDTVSGRRLVLRRFVGDSPTRVSALDQFILLRQLARSGYLAPNDVLTTTDGTFECTYDYIESPTLDRLPHTATDGTVLCLLGRITVALHWLHTLGFLHCDVKPANILCLPIDGQYTPRILDLDLAHKIGDRLTSKIVGTGGYIAPELIDGEELTCAADVFSFGIMMRGLRSRFTQSGLGEEIDGLADRCTRQAAENRLQTFEHVLEELAAIGRRHAAPLDPDPNCEPPLRESGVAARVRSLERLLERSENRFLVLACGPPGSGKSLLLREWCLRLQLGGCPTLRLEEVDDAAALDPLLERTVSVLRQMVSPRTLSPLHVIVETSPRYHAASDHINRLHRTAQGLGLRILLESRTPEPFPDAGPFPVVRLRLLSERECIQATGHLIREDGPVGMNGKCLQVLAGGVPVLLRMAVKSRRRLEREMPTDFDHLSDEMVCYWADRFEELGSNCQWLLLRASAFHRRFTPRWLPRPGLRESQAMDIARTCVRAGWLVRDGCLGTSDAYRFICRSARNAVQTLAGPPELKCLAGGLLSDGEVSETIRSLAPLEHLQLSRVAGQPWSVDDGVDALWKHVESPEDEKLMLMATLQHARALRAVGRSLAPAEYARCCEAFGQLGNFRSQKRWARRGLHRVAEPDGALPLSADLIMQTSRLWDQTGDHSGKKNWLKEAIARVPDHATPVRGVLLSELGSVQLMSGELQTAHFTLHQAQACLDRSTAPDRGAARNMIRLGIVEGMLKKFGAAEQSLKRALAYDRTVVTADIRRRILANLGWNAQRAGRPGEAIGFLLEAMRLFDRAGMFPEHVAVLSNLVACFADIGHGSRARRAAVSAATLAQSIRNTIQVAYAQNSLGWVLGMQGRVAEACEALETARRAALELGDPLFEFRVRLNLSRLYATAQRHDRAIAICDELHESLGQRVGLEEQWDRARLLARIWIDSGQYDRATAILDQIPANHPELTDRDRVSADLLRVSLLLWTGDADRAQNAVAKLRQEPITSIIHPLRCELTRVTGHLELLRGAHDTALDALGEAAQSCRIAGRKDLLLEVIALLSLLASRMGNTQTAQRYLLELERMEKDMQEELP